MLARIERPLAYAVLGALTLLSAGCLAWVVLGVLARPPDYGEACILFNAARIRDGLPLWVDPVVGAHEYGDPPARYFVAYTPFYAAFLALVPSSAALTFGRLMGALVWFGALAAFAARARSRCRTAAWALALVIASTFLFARWSACARPDAFAVVLAGAAFARSIDRGRADAIAGIGFAIAAVLKPSVFGLAAGALVVSGAIDVRRRWSGAAGAAVTLALVAVVLFIISGGAAGRHLGAALGLTFDASRAFELAARRLPFVLPAVTLAAVGAWPERRSPAGKLALAGIAASIATAVIGFGKLGSAANYLMEPALGSLIVVARFPIAGSARSASKRLLAGIVLASVSWTAVATARSLHDESERLPARARFLERVRARCVDRPGAFVISDDPGIEMHLNGRIYTHALELENEVRHGRFPEEIWARDVASPAVRCVVADVDAAHPPPLPAVWFPPAIRDAVHARFRLESASAGLASYERTAP